MVLRLSTKVKTKLHKNHMTSMSCNNCSESLESCFDMFTRMWKSDSTIWYETVQKSRNLHLQWRSDLIIKQMSRLVTKPTKWHVRSAKTQISLGIRPVWSESSLSEWRKLGSLAIHWAHSEDSDQTGRMPRLIWIFAGRTCHFMVLLRGGNTGPYYDL